MPLMLLNLPSEGMLLELDILMHPPLLLMNPTVAFALGVAYTRHYAAGGPFFYNCDATGPYILGLLLAMRLAMDLDLLLMDPLVLVVLLVEMLLYLAL